MEREQQWRSKRCDLPLLGRIDQIPSLAQPKEELETHKAHGLPEVKQDVQYVYNLILRALPLIDDDKESEPNTFSTSVSTQTSIHGNDRKTIMQISDTVHRYIEEKIRTPGHYMQLRYRLMNNPRTRFIADQMYDLERDFLDEQIDKRVFNSVLITLILIIIFRTSTNR